MTKDELKSFLDFKALQYENSSFVLDDPILIPKQFTHKKDIEITGLITATFSWGNRKSIIKSGMKLNELFDYNPFAFISQYGGNKSEKKLLKQFVHRTFNFEDLDFFIRSLNKIYARHDSLESIFYGNDTFEKIANFRAVFLSTKHGEKSVKHLPDVQRGSAAKRINMMLRWFCRDNSPVDFGIWKTVSKAELLLPLDVHTGNISRKLGLLKRNQNDRKAVEEITERLKELNPLDPVKYDFALFGIGAYEKEFNKD
jgi:uncharacterized protein (TIGR02757 family)